MNWMKSCVKDTLGSNALNRADRNRASDAREEGSLPRSISIEQLGAYTDDLDYVFYDVIGAMLSAVDLPCRSEKEKQKKSIS